MKKLVWLEAAVALLLLTVSSSLVLHRVRTLVVSMMLRVEGLAPVLQYTDDNRAVEPDEYVFPLVNSNFSYSRDMPIKDFIDTMTSIELPTYGPIVMWA
ncbi:hypothetical protein V6N11_067987 [Hibiscus sabdariffa]|uniref:Uncharacterized protein n=1 Tax=Hibiscus sabdariffa TaxID=183260 RepID=A0ABR2ST44_9ROSI